MAEDKGIEEVGKKDTADVVSEHTTTSGTKKKKSRGIFSKIWNGIFRVRGDDFERRLQNISKEESVVLARLKRRSQTWRHISRNIILLSIVLEIIAVSYAIMTTRTVDLNWKMRAFRVLPMFLLPGLSTIIYSSIMSFTKMRVFRSESKSRIPLTAISLAVSPASIMICPDSVMKICKSKDENLVGINLGDRKDQKTLERLRSERQAKIDELKERTNYYITQQLIQKYDSDPAAKAAAASVLASKLGADSGLKVFLENESKLNVASGKSNDVEIMQSGSLRNRKQAHTQLNSLGGSPSLPSHEETPVSAMSDSHHSSELSQLVVNHQNPQVPVAKDGGWIAKIAALLVGEDPMQSYALICGNCHMHNGLARREDYPYVTYYCPHCHALNRPKQSDEQVSGSMISTPGTDRSRDSADTANDPNLSQGEIVLTSNQLTGGSSSKAEAVSDAIVASVLADQ